MRGARRREHITPILRSLPPLASGAAEDRFQSGCGNVSGASLLMVVRVSLYRIERPGGKCPRSSLVTVAAAGCIRLPRVLTSIGQRGFAFYGATVCCLLCATEKGYTFCRRLKTYLFGRCLTPPGAVWRFQRCLYNLVWLVHYFSLSTDFHSRNDSLMKQPM